MAEMDDPVFYLWCPGAPRGKGRHRARIIKPRNGPPFVSMYTDAETVKYEEMVANAARAAWVGKGPLEQALTAYIEVFIPIPESWSNRKRDAAIRGDIPAISRPDIDNFIKIILDSLNGIILKDDAQIVSLTSTKEYSAAPGIRVQFWSWDDLTETSGVLV